MYKKIIALSFIFLFYSCFVPYDKEKVKNLYNNIKEEINSNLPNNDKNKNSNGDDPIVSSIKITNFVIPSCENCTYYISNENEEITTILVELSYEYFDILTKNISIDNRSSIMIEPSLTVEPDNSIVIPEKNIPQTLLSKESLELAICQDTSCPTKINEKDLPAIKNTLKSNINEFSELEYLIRDPETNISRNFKIIFKIKEDKKIVEYNLNETIFKMSELEANLEYIKNATPIKVAYSFSIADTELSFGVWEEVYNWAIENEYKFIYTGSVNTYNRDVEKQPVVNISYYDAIVWTNALTEYYNLINTDGKTELSYVYTKNNYPIKDATNLGSYKVNINATGFRLPDFDEWELTARYLGEKIPSDIYKDDEIKNTYSNGKTFYWAPEFIINGPIYYSVDSLNQIAWFNKIQTKNVEENVNANILGIYDMLGNVQEFCNKKVLTTTGVLRPQNEFFIKGGSYLSTESDLQIGLTISVKEILANNYTGFRLAKTN